MGNATYQVNDVPAGGWTPENREQREVTATAGTARRPVGAAALPGRRPPPAQKGQSREGSLTRIGWHRSASDHHGPNGPGQRTGPAQPCR